MTRQPVSINTEGSAVDCWLSQSTAGSPMHCSR